MHARAAFNDVELFAITDGDDFELQMWPRGRYHHFTAAQTGLVIPPVSPLVKSVRGDGQATDTAGIAVSAGAACSSKDTKAMLKAMQAKGASCAVRISGGWQSQAADFERLAEVLRDL